MTGSTPTFAVAIDGPAGSGKSSVSREAAKRLGFAYLDTGSAYRAFAWFCLDRDVDLADGRAVLDALDTFELSLSTAPDEARLQVGRDDVTDVIREPRITAAVGRIAWMPAVRSHLTARFRSEIRATARPGIVVEGRDITTVVAPDAPVRILLTAAEDVRIARRSAELDGVDRTVTSRALLDRDATDSRVVDFMNAATGVSTIDSTELDLEQTVEAVVRLVSEVWASS